MASHPSPKDAGAAGIGLADKIDFLSAPENWPERTACVTVVQTHHAWLFMTERHVYKMKKPSRSGGLDFSTLESRHRLCLDEYRLNRRLAPYTYLGVVPLVLTDAGRLAVNGEGRVVEWLVRMRRLPESSMLTVLAAEGGVTDARIEAFVRKLAAFHEQAPACRFETGAYGAGLRERLESWYRALSGCRLDTSAEAVAAIRNAQSDCLDTCAGLLESRQRDGYVREVHGDLRPEHVFFPRNAEPEIIDCLEFDAHLRQLDVAAELAYFAMECRHASFAGLARRSVAEYRRQAPDAAGPDILLDLHASLAATERAGLMAWRILESPGTAEWQQRADAYLDDARHYIEKAESSTVTD